MSYPVEDNRNSRGDLPAYCSHVKQFAKKRTARASCLGISVSRQVIAASPSSLMRTSQDRMLASPRFTAAHHMLMCMCMMTTNAIERPGSRSRAV